MYTSNDVHLTTLDNPRIKVRVCKRDTFHAVMIEIIAEAGNHTVIYYCDKLDQVRDLVPDYPSDAPDDWTRPTIGGDA